MNERAYILGRIKKHTLGGIPLNTGTRRAHGKRDGKGDSLVSEFLGECETQGMDARSARGHGEALEAIASLVTRCRARRVIKWDDAALDGLAVDDRLDSMGVAFNRSGAWTGMEGTEKTRWLETAAGADLGISGADFALADTGSLVFTARPGRERVPSLLPPVHVAVIGADRVLKDSDALIRRLGSDEAMGGEAGCVTLITGPSKTADIEMNLVRGVHGPGQVHVIVLL